MKSPYIGKSKPLNELKQIESPLIEACISGERDAQNRLYQKYKAKMFGVCLRYARTQAEAEDMLLEGFFNIFKDLHQFRMQGSLEGWMRKVMVNNAIAHIRKYRKKELQSFGLENDTITNSTEPAVWRKDNLDSIIQLIRALPLGYQTIFNLYAVEGYSHKEIAKMLKIAESTSRSQYTRARQILQQKLTDNQ
ncbi:MAG: sigma-70 family RNA polymerase sigma factor [Bacteroidia bacterium]